MRQVLRVSGQAKSRSLTVQAQTDSSKLNTHCSTDLATHAQRSPARHLTQAQELTLQVEELLTEVTQRVFGQEKTSEEDTRKALQDRSAKTRILVHENIGPQT